MTERRDKQVVFTAFDAVNGRGKEIGRFDEKSVTAWDISPSGRELAMLSVSPENRCAITTLSLADHQSRTLALDEAAALASLAWAADESGFLTSSFAAEGGALTKIDRTGRMRVLRDLRNKGEFFISIRPSPDGRHLAFTQGHVKGNAWLLENPRR